jgi:hypothetical protein
MIDILEFWSKLAIYVALIQCAVYFLDTAQNTVWSTYFSNGKISHYTQI